MNKKFLCGIITYVRYLHDIDSSYCFYRVRTKSNYGKRRKEKETVESENECRSKKTAQTFRSVYMKEKSELNTLKGEKKKLSIVWKKKDIYGRL